MKKLTFKVRTQKDFSLVSLIKEMEQISCRVLLDLENGFVTVENVNDTMIDTVIELVDNYYTILDVNIDNTFEEPVEKQSTILEPQSKDDLIVKEVEFQNEHIENRINGLLKTAAWVLYNKSATEKEIGEYILTACSEISMRYSAKPIIDFSIGDIVDVNYGSHLPGEIMGGHVHAIVCNILHNDMVYVVPITKSKTDITSQSYLFMDAPQDATYNNEFYRGGTVLIDKGKYLRAERFNSIVGTTTPAFFEKLLKQLAFTFDFTDLLMKDDHSFAKKQFEKATVASISTGNNVDEVAEKHIKTAETNPSNKKVGGEEAALLEAIGTSLDKLDKSKSSKEQIESFMAEIGMSTTVELLVQSFVIACDIKKINYENVILELHTLNPNIKKNIIKTKLQEVFKSWLEQYPTLAEKCPNISLMSLLKAFAKRFA